MSPAAPLRYFHRVQPADVLPPPRKREYRMRTGSRVATWIALMASLAACNPAAQPGSSIAQAAAAIPPGVNTPPRPPATSTSVPDAGPAIAIAREAAERAAREQTLRVQKQLRGQQRKQQQAREAARNNRNERCIAGQKMRRVANGWAQAGVC
jgi:hypothetical protein